MVLLCCTPSTTTKAQTKCMGGGILCLGIRGWKLVRVDTHVVSSCVMAEISL